MKMMYACQFAVHVKTSKRIFAMLQLRIRVHPPMEIGERAKKARHEVESGASPCVIYPLILRSTSVRMMIPAPSCGRNSNVHSEGERKEV